jgi:hypothetical protein
MRSSVIFWYWRISRSATAADISAYHIYLPRLDLTYSRISTSVFFLWPFSLLARQVIYEGSSR